MASPRTTEPEVERELVALARSFAEREIRPVAAHHDRTAEVPHEVIRKAASLGLASFDLPAEHGGGGIESLLTACLVVEELGRGDGPIGSLVTSGGFFAGPVVALGTPEQQRRWLPALCGDDPPLTGLAVTEPGVGSDAAALTTTANRVEGGYRLEGTKTWVSGAPDADRYLVYATVAPGSGARGITCFVVARDDAGVVLGQPLGKLGSRCYPTAELRLEGCVVDEDRRIGAEGEGFRGVMGWVERTRVQLAANAVGIGRAALDVAVAYAREREAFGSPIHRFQAVSFRLVDARLRLDQARLLTHHAARLADAGEPFGVEASMAKIAASEAAWEAANAAVATLGSFGYSTDYPLEKWLRDAKLEEIYEGTNDIQRLIVARSMFGR
jgi:alkylation response protein AidB-like acyl-CoA dehydrogenase